MAHKFLVKKRMSLGFLGDGWQECYIEVAPFTPAELRVILDSPVPDDKTPQAASINLDQTTERLQNAFVSGRGLTDTGVVELTANDIVLMPLEVTTRLAKLVMGDIDPNSATPSTN